MKKKKITRKDKIQIGHQIPIKENSIVNNPPDKTETVKPVISSEIWKAPSGKLYSLKVVAGDYITPDGITFDEQNLKLLNWTRISG